MTSQNEARPSKTSFIKCSVCLIFLIYLNLWANEWPLLKQAEVEVRKRNYKTAIDLTWPLLDQLRLSSVEEIAQGHKILGFARCELGDIGHAKEHFEVLIVFSPNESIEQLQPSAGCQKLFQQIKQPIKSSPKKIQTSSIDDAGLKTRPISYESTNRTVNLKIQPDNATTSDSTWKLWMPFGIGQFVNDERKKGLFFMASEGVMFGTAVTSLVLFYQEDRINGKFVHPDRGRNYQALFWSSLGVGLALEAWGVVDARSVHQKRKRKSMTAHTWKIQPTSLEVRF